MHNMYLPNCSGYVDQRIALVQHCERVLVAMHEPLLHVSFPNWEEEPQHAILLSLQHRYAVLLCNIPYPPPSEQLARKYACHAVEGVVDDPVEHLVEKGETLEKATVYVVAEARRIWCGDLAASQIPNVGWVLGRCDLVRLAVAIGRI